MDEQPRLLTQDEVVALPPGTEVVIRWSGGTGPALYRIRDTFDDEYAYVEYNGIPLDDPVTFVGKERFHTQVWLAERELKRRADNGTIRPSEEA